MPSIFTKRAVTAVEPDYVRALMDITLNHNFGSTLLGVLGGVAGETTRGLISSREKKKKDRRPATPWSLIRSGAAGGGLGFMASRAFPVQSSKLNRAILENLFLKPTGLVASNLINHFGYNDSFSVGYGSKPNNKLQELMSIIKQQPMAALKSVLKDQPLVPTDIPSVAERRQAVRHIFTLPTDYSRFDRNADGTYSLKGGSLEGLQQSLNAKLEEDPTIGPKKVYNDLLGNVVLIPNKDGSSYSYRDRWDFDLAEDERVDNTTNFFRHLVSRLTKPMVFEGTIQTPQMD